MNYDWQHLLKTYKSLVKPNYTVLEIGASTLSHTKKLAKYCQNLIGVELLASRIPKSKNKNIKYIISDWQNLSKKIKKNSIDLAIASHVIEHVLNDELALIELHKVLKPGAVALINTPNRLRLARSIVEIFTGPRKFPWWEHVREYSFKDINKLCENSPFEKYIIKPIIFGFHNGYFKIYIKKVPRFFVKYANYWEISLIK